MIADEVKKLEQENNTLRVQLEQMQKMYGDKPELPKRCEYCRHFVQHYVKCGTFYMPTNDGHCVAGCRIKDRKAKETCKYFAQKEFAKNFI